MADFNSSQQKYANEIRQRWSWHFMAKEIADYTNETFFNIMDRPAIEVLSIASIIQAQVQINKVNQVTNNGKKDF